MYDPKTTQGLGLSTLWIQKLWFAWASRQDVEFREPDPFCGWNPKCLAGDGTKIGICLSRAMVSPIDRRHGDGIQTPNRRLGRYFIASQHLVPAEAKRASEAKAHLKDMCDMIVSGKANDMTLWQAEVP